MTEALDSAIIIIPYSKVVIQSPLERHVCRRRIVRVGHLATIVSVITPRSSC